MSHTYTTEDGTTFIHNPDMSGIVDVVVELDPHVTRLSMPGSALVEFMRERDGGERDQAREMQEAQEAAAKAAAAPKPSAWLGKRVRVRGTDVEGTVTAEGIKLPNNTQPAVVIAADPGPLHVNRVGTFAFELDIELVEEPPPQFVWTVWPSDLRTCGLTRAGDPLAPAIAFARDDGTSEVCNPVSGYIQFHDVIDWDLARAKHRAWSVLVEEGWYGVTADTPKPKDRGESGTSHSGTRKYAECVRQGCDKPRLADATTCCECCYGSDEHSLAGQAAEWKAKHEQLRERLGLKARDPDVQSGGVR